MRNRVRKDLRIELFSTDDKSKLSCEQLNTVEDIIGVFEFHFPGCFESIDTEAEVKDKIKHLNQSLNEAKLELAELIIQRHEERRIKGD